MIIYDKRKNEIENIVAQFCKDCSVSEETLINVVAIARKKGFEVQRLNMSKNTIGMLLYSKENNISGLDTNKVIAVKQGLPKEQSRYVLAHELGYYSLFCEKTPVIAHRKSTHPSTSLNEQEADYFARALLLPQERVVTMIKFLREQNCDDNAIINEIAKTFIVAKPKAKIRFYELLQKATTNENEVPSNKYLDN